MGAARRCWASRALSCTTPRRGRTLPDGWPCVGGRSADHLLKPRLSGASDSEGFVISGVRSPVHSRTFFPHEIIFCACIHTFFNAGIFTLYRECAQGSAQFASYGGASRRLVLCFPLSLLLPHTACTHALSLYRTHPSVCFALRWIKESNKDSLIRQCRQRTVGMAKCRVFIDAA